MKKKQGFTLAELLIIIAIIAVLVAIGLPIFSNQLEKSRRAVDMADARNISIALATGVNSGDIEFTSQEATDSHSRTNKACIAIVVGKEGTKYFVSGNIKVDGKTSKDGAGHDRIKKYLNDNGISDYLLKAKSTNNNGWNFYAIFMYSDGTFRIGSGVDDGYDDYKDDTFEYHATNWSRYPKSNIEKAMGL